jgi:DNA primase
MRPLPLEDVRDQIRLRVNLLDVVQQHVRLRKQGREYVGLCPFHQERTASFSVNEQKQSWYCFGCQRGGDVFEFVALVERTDFAGALRILAEMAGVDLPERGGGGGERTQLRRRILELNRLAAQYYEYVLHALPAGEPGRELLNRRQVDETTARRFGLGYAPGGASLAAFLLRRGRSLQEAETAGLVRNGRDYFQRRLVMPIRDERGQPVAFTGRTVLADEPRKYVNSPETLVYVKGRVLFALDLARMEIEGQGYAVLMEGQFDVISAHQHGLSNAVASSGTALTVEQLRLLRRFTDEVVLLFDNDRGGRAAAERAIGLARKEGLQVRVARIPGQAKDPDEFLRAGGDWRDLLQEALPGWEVMIRDRIEGLNPHAPGDRELGVRRIREVLDQIQDPAEKDIYAERAGRLFDIDPRLLLAGGRTPTRGRWPAEPSSESVPSDRLTPSVPGNRLSKSVGYLLQVLVVRPEVLGRVRRGLDPEALGGDDRAAYLRVVNALERGGVEGLEGELDDLPAEVQNLVRRAWAAPPPSVGDQVVDELVARIHQESLRRRRREIIRGLEEAERRQDHARARALAVELKRLRERG